VNRSRIEPGPGRESVWDYPRPPQLEETNKRVGWITPEIVGPFKGAPGTRGW